MDITDLIAQALMAQQPVNDETMAARPGQYDPMTHAPAANMAAHMEWLKQQVAAMPRAVEAQSARLGAANNPIRGLYPAGRHLNYETPTYNNFGLLPPLWEVGNRLSADDKVRGATPRFGAGVVGQLAGHDPSMLPPGMMMVSPNQSLPDSLAQAAALEQIVNLFLSQPGSSWLDRQGAYDTMTQLLGYAKPMMSPAQLSSGR